MELKQSMTIQMRADGVKWREVAGTIVVMDLRKSMYLSVEGSLVTVWPRLVHGMRFDALVDELAEEFDASREVIESDLESVIESLVTRDVLFVLEDD